MSNSCSVNVHVHVCIEKLQCISVCSKNKATEAHI